jgi:hypothetical protein
VVIFQPIFPGQQALDRADGELTELPGAGKLGIDRDVVQRHFLDPAQVETSLARRTPEMREGYQ